MPDEEMEREVIEEPLAPEGRWRKVKRALTLLMLLFLFAVGVIGGIGAYIAKGLAPVKATGEAVTVEIKQGMNSFAIAELLEEEGLIHSSFIFKYYLRFKGEGTRFQAGKYSFEPGISIDELIAKLNKGDTIQVDMFRFTVPEGYTIEQMARDFAAKGLSDIDSFLALANSPSAFPGTRADKIPARSEYKFALEGYLFPDTYELPEVDVTGRALIRRMLSELDNKLKTLPPDWEQRLEKLGISFHEMMAIASLIEREVIVDEERPLVAGVIYNRLKIGMPLQIDATVQYALDEHKERLLTEDTKVESPYNTYLHTGIPPGPIASPGIRSIEAALYPEETKYLYYVTKKDGSNEHYFAETHDGHIRNRNLSEKNAQKAGAASQ